MEVAATFIKSGLPSLSFGPGGAGPYRIFVNEKVNVKVGGNLVS